MFTIITVCYNNLSGLLRTYKSIKGLDGGDYEWIVIDGGSDDGTKEFLSTVELRSFKWVSEPDDGIYNAMNKGIKFANGDYCIFMNSGDYFASDNILQKAKESLAYGICDLLYGDSYEEENGIRYLKLARDPRLNFYSLFTHHQSIFYKTKSIQAGYDESYKISGDWALTTRVLKRSKDSSFYLKVPVSVFERGGVSQQNRLRATINEEHFSLLIDEAGLPYILAKVVWGIKISINLLREKFPKFYDFLRYRN